MITLEQDGVHFNYCVDGVAIHEGHVLLTQARGFGFWFTPGGRVEMRETSRDALLREMREELGVEVEVGRLLWVVENFFQHDGTPAHELAFMYKITLPAGCPLLDVRYEHHNVDAGVPLTFRWFPIDELERVEMVPKFLRHGLRALPEYPSHVIHVDG